MSLFRLSILVSILFCLVSTSLLADDCAPAPKSVGPVSSVSAVDRPGQKPEPSTSNVELGSWIAVDVTDLDILQREAKCSNKKIVVFLDGRPVAGLAIIGPLPNYPKTLYFRLSRTADARALWDEILSAPNFDQRDLDITVGIDGQVPLPAKSGLKLQPLDYPWAAAAGFGFLGLVVFFIFLALGTNVLRDGTPTEDAVPITNGRLDPTRSAGNRGTYSLAKLQGAWWLFIILCAYLLIGIVTWDFYTSLSSTALILLGISSGTVVGGAVIDASKATPEQKAAEASKAAEYKRQIEQLDAEEYAKLEAGYLDDLFAPGSFDANAQARRNSFIARYGDASKWLRSTGGLFAEIADIFELVQLGRPVPGSPQEARKQELNAKLPKNLNDLCELAVLTKRSPAPGTREEARLNALKATIGAQPARFLGLVPRQSDLAAQRTLAISRYKKLTGQSEAWFIDILSDANGVSLHRFQLFAWTAILGIIFIVASYRNLAMPIFDTTLMGLLGLSAGTYLGLKIPEPTVPK